jgi:hypothetical protein
MAANNRTALACPKTFGVVRQLPNDIDGQSREGESLPNFCRICDKSWSLHGHGGAFDRGAELLRAQRFW